MYRNTQYGIVTDLGKNVLKLENTCLDEKGSGLLRISISKPPLQDIDCVANPICLACLLA